MGSLRTAHFPVEREAANMATAGTTTKGIYWRDREVEAVLKALHREGAGRRVMTSTNIETTDIFQAVSSRLEDQGR